MGDSTTTHGPTAADTSTGATDTETGKTGIDAKPESAGILPVSGT